MTCSRRTAICTTVALLFAAGAFLLFQYWPKRSEVRPASVAANRKSSLPCITVEATYPGADAATLMQAVAVPIEEKVNGVKDMLSMMSQCTNDGVYTLRIAFKKDVDLNIAQVLVQNRIALATPLLPQLVQQHGLIVKKAPSSALMFVTLSSPDGRFDDIYLSNYATLQIQDELRRVPGVGDVMTLGQREFHFRISFDAAKLAARQLTAAEATAAIENQNIPVISGQLGQPPIRGPKGADPIIVVSTRGRLIEPGELGDLRLITVNGAPVFLKDVAAVEKQLSAAETHSRCDGMPVALIAVSLMPPASAAETQKVLMERLRAISSQLPQDAALNIPFDFTANLESSDASTRSEYLRLDVVLPFSSSIERTLATAQRCEALLREVPGVQHVLTLCGRPYTFRANEACILVALAPDAGRHASREQIMLAMRTRLHDEIADAATFFLSDLSRTRNFPKANYSFELAIVGHELSEARGVAEELAELLRNTGKLTDVRTRTSERVLTLDIDRAKSDAAGVSIADIRKALDDALGPEMTWAGLGGEAGVVAKLKDSKVRNNQGQFALNSFVQVREASGVAVLERFDQLPMAPITANLAPDVTKEEVRAICEEKALKLLPDGCRLEWLDDK